MKTTTQLLGAVSAFALVVMSSAPALAAGTSAGDTITNNVSVTFDVGGVTQIAETDSDTFTVDRRVNVTVTYVGSATSVTPGQDNAVLVFDVTNLSNDTIDLALDTALNAGTGANIDNYRIYADTNGNDVFDAGDTLVTYLDEVAEDDTIRVFVLADIGLNAANGDDFDVTLTANAHLGDGAGALGSELVGSTGANDVNGIDTVLFDGMGDTDVENDGAFSDTGTYTVTGADITVAKSSRVVWDPVNLEINPKAIPGARVEYCITVANATGTATATDVNVVDDLPFDVSFLTGTSFINGDENCANGTAGGTFSAETGPNNEDQVLAALDDVAAGETRSVYFRVEIR
ncbi:MAG: hypothetical protein NWS68_03320 [Erythrobacter sp.]|nr:hypothetical protein [Erythrobacter sp.]